MNGLIDLETINAILKMLEQEIAKYEPGSPEAVALWKFKELLDNL